jgi:glycine/D-amino acid oxidase-like deaminating enzyme
VFGTWTAHHLRAAGCQVTLVDAYGPGNSRSSSGDETRILRCGYGPDAIYTELASRSLLQWQALDNRFRGIEDAIWHPCGVLWMAEGDDAYTRATHETLVRAKYRHELLDREALHRRIPLLDPEGIDTALFEPDGGVLMARRAVRVLAEALFRRGVHILRTRVTSIDGGSRVLLKTSDDFSIEADACVAAAGAWLPTLFPDALAGRIRPTRQVVVYFGTAAGDHRFEPSGWPAWIDFPAGIYGTPDIAGRGIKVGIDEHGPAIDPDTMDRLADAGSVERARVWLSRRVPALADAPVVETRVCQYENTATGDFLIDRHPELRNVWLVGGGSGHGFKHGPAVGEIAARMVLYGARADPRFALESKTFETRRAVY